MRSIDRRAVGAPAYFFSSEAAKEADDILNFLRNPEFSRPPEPYHSKRNLSDILDALSKWTHDKCAYCETIGAPHVDHFRPLRGADRGRGQVDRLHYCWLSTEWNNYFPVCSTCASLKSNHFPIRGQSPLGADLAVLREAERAVLLDPSFDNLPKHLLVMPTGEILGRSSRGSATVDLLRLNRHELLSSRARVLERFIGTWNDLVDGLQPTTDLKRFLGPDAVHSGAVYLFVRGLIAKNAPKRIHWLNEPDRVGHLLAIVGRIRPQGLYEQLTHEAHRTYTGYSNREQGRYRSLAIRKLRVTNFKGIKHAELSFPMPNGKEAQWCALVGPNGIGKTSLLQALTLAMAGHNEAGSLVSDARSLLHTGETRGEITLEFWHEDEANTLQFDNSSSQFFGNSNVTPPVLAYGAYRILARRTLQRKYRRKDIRVHTLFDEHSKINGPHGWFKKLQKQKLEDAADVIQQLMLSSGARITVVNGQIQLSIGDKPQPLDSLSSGVQNVFALATDILDVMYSVRNSALSSQAVVLIDELDAHLHPEWRIRIVERLRAAFPSAQFIYTTHDPLTLRGMTGDNVLVLHESVPGILRANPAVPEIENLFVDQLLTSGLFGLNTTLNEALDGKFVRYYDLLSKPSNSLDKPEQDELSGLAEDLQNDGVMGDSMRERIMYRIIDRQLAESRRQPNFNEWSESTIQLIERTLQNNSDYQRLIND